MLPHDLPRPHRTALTPCVAGCTRAGAHRPGCADTCPGCLPLRAERGVLCGGCHRRLVHALDALPGVVERADGAGERAPALYDVVAVWVRDALEHYPAPTARPLRLDAAVRSPATAPAAVRRHPLGVADDAGLADAARDLCGWLDRHLPWVEAQPWAGRLADELGELVDPRRRR